MKGRNGSVRESRYGRNGAFADLADRAHHLFKQAIGDVKTRSAPVLGMAASGNVGLSYALNRPWRPLAVSVGRREPA
jgi:hypothetical protein